MKGSKSVTVLLLLFLFVHTQQQAFAWSFVSSQLSHLSDIEKVNAAAKLSEQKQQLEKEKAAVRSDKAVPVVEKEKLEAIDRASTALSATTDVLQGEPIPTSGTKLQEVNEVIRWYSRPIWVVCDGHPWFPDMPLTLTNDGGPSADFGPVVKPRIDMLRAVARSTGLMTVYQTTPLKTLGPLATAVAINDHLVLTNKHVLTEGRVASENIATGVWKMADGITVKVEFPYEYAKCEPTSGKKEVAVKGIKYVDPDLDFVVLETEPGLSNFVEFSPDSEADPGDRIVVIGYPSRPPDGTTPLSPIQIDKAFQAPNGRTPFPAERMAAGEVFREQTVPDGYFAHDASTWGGNSGSVVVDLATGVVVGLHSRGLESKTEGIGYNEAVSGARISAALAKLK